MAVYKLIPSSFTKSSSSSTLSNASNAYADTDSTTYAQLSLNIADARGWLGGFNFPTLEIGERIVSIIAKVKTYNTISDYGEMLIVSNATKSNVALSSSINSKDCRYLQVYTMEWVQDLDTVYSYRDTLCIEFKQNTSYSSGAFLVYGAEIIVETAEIERNKIIYGGETLIDLTSDTVTKADVLSGKTFHLPSGSQAIGTLVPSPSVATATTSSSSARKVSFPVSKEPSWFMLICSSTNTTARNSRVQHMLYDGTTTTTYYGYGSTTGSIRTSTSHGTFSYSSGTLTITVDSVPYFGEAGWELYYL